jgi:3'-phosphoadenosine 5'-phosphosulfate sulfotransferase (PAPS reductase)/FAD synthetase
MVETGEHIDEVVSCDTTKEFPAMYRHIDRLRRVAEENGIKFTVLRAEHDFDYFMFDHTPKRKNDALEGLQGYSWAGCINRWCTAKLKVDVMERYFRELRKMHNLVQCIGIAEDEQRRLERQYAQKDGYRFPLVEWGWTEQMCLDYCYSQGYDWEGLYGIFKRVSCWCCPLQSLAELKKLRKHFPDLWKELREMDKRTWRKFKPDYSVEDLERRFADEDKQITMEV